MIVKDIVREDGFNKAIINHLYENGDAVCTLQQIESVEQENGSILEVVNKTDDNIVISGLIFTDEELAELNPSQEASEINEPILDI